MRPGSDGGREARRGGGADSIFKRRGRLFDDLLREIISVSAQLTSRGSYRKLRFVKSDVTSPYVVLFWLDFIRFNFFLNFSWLSTKINTDATGSFSFQNAFFYLQWGDDDWVYASDDPLATSLLTLKKTRRKTKLHPHKQRSKYICRPEFIVETGNHFIWEFIPGHNTFNVPADAAILHHYRICEFGGDDCIQTASTVDSTTFKYRGRLIAAVGGMYEQYKKTCYLPELTPPPRRENFKLLNFFSHS